MSNLKIDNNFYLFILYIILKQTAKMCKAICKETKVNDSKNSYLHINQENISSQSSKLNDYILWNHIKKGDLNNLQKRTKYLLQVYGTSLPCNRFDVGNSIEFLLVDFVTSLGFNVTKLPNAKRIDLCINGFFKLSIKYSSVGDITLHNSNSCINKDENMTDLILLTPTQLYLITNNNIKEVGINLSDYLVNTGDSLKLKRTLLTKLENIDFKYKCSLDIKIDRSTCQNKSCAEVFYQKAMEDFDKLQLRE